MSQLVSNTNVEAVGHPLQVWLGRFGLFGRLGHCGRSDNRSGESRREKMMMRG